MLAWLPVLALQPDTVHLQLSSSVHLQPSVDQVLFFLQPGLSEQLAKFI